jgi:hypothetical protein
MSDYKYKGICHTVCYWLDTLWQVGEVYEGSIPLIKHFSVDGEIDRPLPPPDAGSDPRSNKELRRSLKADYNFTAPRGYTRKQLWKKLMELESSSAIDELTSSDMPQYIASCGFEAKTNAGIGAHERHCETCKGMKDGDSS